MEIGRRWRRVARRRIRETLALRRVQADIRRAGTRLADIRRRSAR
jgi:hypothetical protein